MTALRNAMRAKLSPELLRFVNEHYGRFGESQADRVAAYQRRVGRKQYAQQRGWDYRNLNHASGQQIAALNAQGLIGENGGPNRVIQSQGGTGPGITGAAAPVMAAAAPPAQATLPMAQPEPDQVGTPGVAQAPASMSPLAVAMMRRRKSVAGFGSTYG